MDPRITELEDRQRARVQDLLARALASRAGEDPAWDEHLTSLGVRPLSAAQRLEIQAAGVPNLRGAIPVEVRRALAALARQLRAELLALAEVLDEDDDEGRDRIEALQRQVAELPEREARGYLDKARPRASLLGIFANAQQSTIRHAAQLEAVRTRKCPCCGAARPDGADLATCAFCGGAFFPEGSAHG